MEVSDGSDLHGGDRRSTGHPVTVIRPEPVQPGLVDVFTERAFVWISSWKSWWTNPLPDAPGGSYDESPPVGDNPQEMRPPDVPQD